MPVLSPAFSYPQNFGAQAIEPARLGTNLFEPPQENYGDRESDDIRRPHANSRRQNSVLGKMNTGHKKKVVAADEQNCHHESAGPPAAPRTHRHRNAKQREKHTSNRKSEALLQFHTRVAHAAILNGKQLTDAALAITQCFATVCRS